MTLYIFENMTGDQAANFDGSVDQLVFANPATTALNLSIGNSGGLNLVTLTAAGVSRTFAAAELNAASTAGRVAFADGSDATFLTGTSGGDTLAFGGGVSATTNGVYYGFAGNDEIDTTANGHNYVFGGAGGDTINGGSGNDHLYGFGLTGDPSADGDDEINGGAGNDYIQGNAGDDTLSGGDGSDRINGGQGKDLIFGDDGHDVINGNKGDDTISGGDGNDIIRGGQGDDLISGDEGNDVLIGDLGDDTLDGGDGIDVLTGGDGADVFVFGAGDSSFVTTGTLAYVTDSITDFTIGEDMIDLSGTIGATSGDIIHAQAGISLSSVEAALTYAQQLLTAANDDDAVIALQVGADTYLFYDDNGTDSTINAMIQLKGVVAADFTFESIA